MADSIGGPARRTLRQLVPARIAGGAALRVRTVTAGERPIEGGPALPVYYVQDSELRANGGAYTLQGNQPVPIFEAGAGAIVEGAAAMPVYVTNPSGVESVLLLELQADMGVTISSAAFAGTGVITQSGTTVSGVATLFLAQVVVGDRIQAAGIDGIVQSIATNTSLTLDTIATVAVGVIYTITPQAGTARVTTWLDQSGNERDFTQAGTARPSKQTIGGYPAVVFDGIDDWMSGENFADNLISFTVFSVVRSSSDSVGVSVISKQHLNTSLLPGWAMDYSGAQITLTQNDTNFIIAFDSIIDPLDGTWRVFSGEVLSRTDLHLYTNGSNSNELVFQDGVVTNHSNSELVALGRVSSKDGPSLPDYAKVDVRAILLYSPALSASARASKEAELAARYGITL